MARSFPTTSAYITTLPEGLASYPECRVHHTVVAALTRDFGHLAERPGLPSEVRDLLSPTHRGSEWVQETVFQAANLAVREGGFDSDAAFLAWTEAASRDLLDGPILKRLMRLLSPTLVVAGASKRWRKIHEGSSLSAEVVDPTGTRAQSRATLTYPPRIFTELFLRSLVVAFQVAVDGARGRDTLVALVRYDETSAEFETSWSS